MTLICNPPFRSSSDLSETMHPAPDTTDPSLRTTLFSESDLAVPASEAPTVSQLKERGRNNRRWRRGTMGLLGFGLVMMPLALFGPDLSTFVPETPSRSVVETTPLDSGRTIVEASRRSSEARGLQVFATVRKPVPVFDRQQDTQYYRHVGWIDSEAVVPIDVSQVPPEQLRALEALLRDDSGPPRSYSL